MAPVDGPAPVDLNAAIESVLTVARNEWKYVADVVRELDPALPPVSCVPAELQQLVLSLLLEAVRATSAACRTSAPVGTIVVRTAHDAGWVELSVTDGGDGSATDVRAGVLDSASAGDAALRAARPDLVLLRDFVVEHRGAIHVEGRPGQGTMVRVRLPLTDAVSALR
jgi:signal transduction histidine kinase